MRGLITVAVLLSTFINLSFCRNYLKSDDACDVKVEEHCKLSLTGKFRLEVNISQHSI
jgi:hypothetical protein